MMLAMPSRDDVGSPALSHRSEFGKSSRNQCCTERRLQWGAQQSRLQQAVVTAKSAQRRAAVMAS
jgi:hypothetical protein